MNPPRRLARSSVYSRSAFSVAVALLCLACRPTPRRDTSEAFEDLIGAPASASGVLDLQGTSSCGLDCSAWVRFHTDTGTFQELVHKRFIAVPCTAMPPSFTRAPQPSAFNPPWRPQFSPASHCYQGERSLKSHLWLTWLVRDDDTGVTHAFGGTYPKP